MKFAESLEKAVILNRMVKKGERTIEENVFLITIFLLMALISMLEKTNGREVPDRTYEEAGNLAVYYSKAKTAPKAEVDYIERKFVKKPAGAKPGFVIYHTNYSLVASPDISSLKLISGGE